MNINRNRPLIYSTTIILLPFTLTTNRKVRTRNCQSVTCKHSTDDVNKTSAWQAKKLFRGERLWCEGGKQAFGDQGHHRRKWI